MIGAFTKQELRQLWTLLSRLEQPLAGPPTAADVLAAGALCRKTAILIKHARGAVERGRKVFEWRIDPEWAPTQNEFTSWMHRQAWRPGKARTELRRQLTEIIAATPGADLCGARRMRWVRVTRFTSMPKAVDDAAIDAIGGKLPVDVLTKLGVLVDDSTEWLKREAIVARTARGNTHVLVEVFEVADEAVEDDAPPIDAPAPHDGPQRGLFTRAITGEKA